MEDCISIRRHSEIYSWAPQDGRSSLTSGFGAAAAKTL
jgi:hypothetical protein